ncbi:DUF2147 domain-containing protein, partial [Streptomyces sp. SID3343]|nr:DUF2147 domain-containing protein [Streptomyces sp. SID3343]
ATPVATPPAAAPKGGKKPRYDGATAMVVPVPTLKRDTAAEAVEEDREEDVPAPAPASTDAPTEVVRNPPAPPTP